MAALRERLARQLGEGALQTLQDAEDAFRDALGAPPAGRLEHLPSIRQLLWCLGRLDRYCTLTGEACPGTGLDVLRGMLERTAEEVLWGETPAVPRHLGYFLPALREEARRWKHQTAPKVKDRRIREGRRPPRRAAGKPGRGPAIGLDPRKRRRRPQPGSGQ